MQDPSHSALLIVDFQEKLFKATGSSGKVIDRLAILAQCASDLGAACCCTEHYPKGLGPTVRPLREALDSARRFEKTSFDCFGEKGFAQLLRGLHRRHLLVGGIETHICVEQTVSSALKRGYSVSVLADGCLSIDPVEKGFALARMEKTGIEVITVESMVYRWLGNSRNAHFRKYQSELMDLNRS